MCKLRLSDYNVMLHLTNHSPPGTEKTRGVWGAFRIEWVSLLIQKETKHKLVKYSQNVAFRYVPDQFIQLNMYCQSYREWPTKIFLRIQQNYQFVLKLEILQTLNLDRLITHLSCLLIWFYEKSNKISSRDVMSYFVV